MLNRNQFNATHSRITLVMLAVMLWSLISVAALGRSPGDSKSEARQAQIERLRQVIRDREKQEQAPEQVDKAIWQLGELKAIEAIDDLIALLAFKYPQESRVGGAHDGYRAKMALAKIGEPALPALVQVIKDNDIDSVQFINAQFSVMGIFRGRLPEGSKYLREQAGQADSAAAAARLWAAAQSLDDVHAKSEALKKGEKPQP